MYSTLCPNTATNCSENKVATPPRHLIASWLIEIRVYACVYKSVEMEL